MQTQWRIGESTIALHLLDSAGERSPEWKREVGRFATDQQGHRVDLDLTIEPHLAWEPIRDGRSVVVDTTGEAVRQIRIRRASLTGAIEKKQDWGYSGKFTVDANAMAQLAVIVRTCLSFLCEEKGQLLIHASGVWRNDSLWIFCGDSGRGKSTIAAELNDGGELFSLDRVILGLDTDRNVIAYPTPFSDRKPIAADPVPRKVSGIAFIEQSIQTEVLPVHSFEAVRELLGQSLAFSRTAPVWHRLMDLAGRVIEADLCCRLKFAKDPSFWTLLDRRAPGR
jgi:hypothetical protein